MFCAAVLSGCSYLEQPNAPEYAPALQQASVDRIEQRKREAEGNSLTEKAAHFEQVIFTRFKASEHDLFGEERRANQVLIVDLESTALVLAATVLKCEVTRDPKDLHAAQRIVESLIALDQLNGYDGFLPYEVEGASLKIIDGRTHANAYSQLMWAYVLVAQKLIGSEAQLQVRTHAQAIAQYFLKNQFVMRDANGRKIEFSDLSPSRWQLSRSRALDFISIAESLRFLLPVDDPQIGALDRYIRKSTQRGYRQKIQKLHFRFLDYHLPTHGSDWLNMIRLYTLVTVSQTPEYQQALDHLYNRQRHELNPFFALLYEDSSQRETIRQYMVCFPLSVDNALVLPSDNLQLKPYPPYMKNERMLEAEVPLPIYQRPLTDHEWKRNPYRVYGGTINTPIQYSGTDYYLAYWLGRANGMIEQNW